MFVTFEGVDGSGKSTQIELLREWLQQRGLEAVATAEPGATPLGLELRRLLLTPDTGSAVSPRAEALLYAADRAQHVHEVIRPALDRGAWVLGDRYIDSTIAYQGGGRGLSSAALERLNAWAADGLVPDLTVLLDLDVSIASRRRAGAGEDRLEAERIEFHERVRRRFLSLARAHPDRFTVIDAERTVDVVHDDVVRAVSSL